MLATLIRAYQAHPPVNRAVRRAVRIHHAFTPRQVRVACPYAGACSAAGLDAALTQGWSAAGPIVARMARCESCSHEHPWR
jgi:putative component of membrane protein insertase Oxa1/YidC/SpoIIIJ protein YidD